jgi:guanine deaminase
VTPRAPRAPRPRKAGARAESASSSASAEDRRFLAEASELSLRGMRRGKGGPFGALVVKDGHVIGRGCNEVTSSLDPTAHAEVNAIRAACRKLKDFSLEGCVLYTSCEPCPMCLGAAYWARVGRVVYANTRRDAEAIGFSDAFIYAELERPPARRKLALVRIPDAAAEAAFREWREKRDKTPY